MPYWITQCYLPSDRGESPAKQAVSSVSTAAMFSRFYGHRIQTWAINAASYRTRWIL